MVCLILVVQERYSNVLCESHADLGHRIDDIAVPGKQKCDLEVPHEHDDITSDLQRTGKSPAA